MSNSVNGGLRTRPVERFGWVPDLPDARDFMFSAPESVLTKLPTKVNLTSKMPPVYDQGQLGSCTANAIGAAFEFDQVKEGYKDFMPSRLFIYYNERAMEGTIDTDSGAMIRDGMKSVAKVGVCAEDTWAYDISKFTEKPPAKAYTEAKKHQALLYKRVIPMLHQLQGCLAAGYPVVFGFSVYESFMSPDVAKTGEVPLPPRGEQLIGGYGRWEPNDNASNDYELFISEVRLNHAAETVTVAGHINEAGDVFAEDYPLPPVAEGDILALLNAGGYHQAMSSTHCLRPHAPAIFLDR